VAPRYVPRPPDVTYWGATSKGVPNTLRGTAPDILPFRPAIWQNHYDVDGYPKWIARPSNSAFLPLNTTLQLYAPAAPRMFIGADTSAHVWIPKSQGMPLALRTAVLPTQSLFGSTLIASRVG